MQKRAVCLQVQCHLVRPDQVSRAGHVVTVVLGRAGAELGLLGLWPPHGAGAGSHLLVTAALLRLCAAAVLVYITV